MTTLHLRIKVLQRGEEREPYLEIARLEDDGSVHSRVAVRRCDLPRFIESLKAEGAKLIGADEIKALFGGDELARAQQLVGIKKPRRR